MTNIKHIDERKIEINFDSKKKLEYLILLLCSYKVEYTYQESTNTLVIECENDVDMFNLLENIKHYLHQA